MQDTTLSLNNYLSRYWVVLLIGILNLLLHERAYILHKLLRKTKKTKNIILPLRPLLHRFWYVLGGAFLVYAAWSIVNLITSVFLSSADTIAGASEQNLATFAGPVAVLGLIAAGSCLTLSAGSRWLVTTAKLLAMFSIIALFALTFAGAMTTAS